MEQKATCGVRKCGTLIVNRENSHETRPSKLPGSIGNSFNVDSEATVHSTPSAPKGFKEATNLSVDTMNAPARKRPKSDTKDEELAGAPNDLSIKEISVDKMHPGSTSVKANDETGQGSSFSKEASPDRLRLIEAAMGQAYYVAANMLPKKHGHFDCPIIPKANDPLFLPLLGLEVVTDYLTAPVNDADKRKSSNLICSQCLTDVTTRWFSYKVANQVSFRCAKCQELHLVEDSRKERVRFLVNFVSQAIEKIDIVSREQGQRPADFLRRDSTELEEHCVMEWQKKEGETVEIAQKVTSVGCAPIELVNPPN